MALDPQLVGLMQQTISLKFSSATADLFGEIGLGAATTMLCRIEAHNREYERLDGTEVRTSHLIIMNALTGFTPTMEMQVFFPGESSSTAAFARKPQKIHGAVDEYGALEHWELIF